MCIGSHHYKWVSLILSKAKALWHFKPDPSPKLMQFFKAVWVYVAYVINSSQLAKKCILISWKNFVDFEKFIGNRILFADFIKKFADFQAFKILQK